MLEAARIRVHEVLDPIGAGDRTSFWVNGIILVLILLSVTALVMESVAWIRDGYGHWLDLLEGASVAVFTVEYLSRLWSCTVDFRYRHPLWGRLRYLVTPMALVDLCAILPFYVAVFAPHLIALRSVRLFRLLRLAKLVRYSHALHAIGAAVRREKEELTVVILILLILLVISATLIFYAENEAQPEVFSSIPAAMWWAAATFTTVGYGDIYPITPLGKFMASLFALFGIGMFALPAGILSASFSEELKRRRRGAKREVCPHCGGEL